MATLLLLAVALLLVTSMVLLISRDWRVTILFMGLQYIGVFILIQQSWPVEMAIVKLVSGWMAAAILGATLGSSGIGAPESDMRAAGGLFRFLAGGLVAMIAFSLSPETLERIPELTLAQSSGGLLLMGFGFLILGFTASPLRVVIGILMFFAGFEVFYSAVESSVLVAGLLAIVTLALSLIGAYLAQSARSSRPETPL